MRRSNRSMPSPTTASFPTKSSSCCARGYETAKVVEIAYDCGLSMGTIYAIFPGKAELYGALLEERGQELLRLARGVAARDLDLKEASLSNREYRMIPL